LFVVRLREHHCARNGKASGRLGEEKAQADACARQTDYPLKQHIFSNVK
jgi:hypothetical protein